MKRLNGAGTRALAGIRGFSLAQKTIALIGAAVLVLGGVALAGQLSKPTYGVLYSNLSDTEASAVVAQLGKDKVDYQLQGTGTILVPQAAVNSERLATATLLSSGAGGYSLLDKMGVTASEFQQNTTYKRAIEGELAKTIESIDGVSSASVMLAIPQQTVFTDDKQDPTASVTIDAPAGLTTDQVGAVVHLVAAAYPGLTDKNVSVVDQKGDTLAAVGGGASGSAAEQASDYETRTKVAVQTMLDKILGPGNSTVTVAADVSQSSGTKKSQTYTTPSQAPVLSQSNNDQTYTGNGAAAAAGGTMGTGDTTTGTTGTTGGSGGNYKSSQGVKNNAVDSTTTEETITPGTLNRQTIAVAVNQSALGQVSPTAVQTMVQNAAGYSAARGDTISVTPVAFSTAAAKQAAAALKQSQSAQSSDQMMNLITLAIKVVGGIVGFVLVVGLLRKLFKRQEPTELDGGTLNVVQNVVSGGPTVVAAPGSQVGAAAPTAVLNTGFAHGPIGSLPASADPEFARLQADVDALAGADPAQTAEYLRALMGDRASA